MTERFNFVYDPARQGFDTTLWKQLSGTTSAVSVVFPDIDGGTEGIQEPFDSLTLSEAVTVVRS